ncbi:hypothetical protein F-M6_0023 [Faustovirus]|nr:hypothetical protein F-LCD7_0023 [Faustovirus]QJX71786.1 hypothetical protein F-M6_0023 [Faustovirus]QJX73797.1 hypothetical protein F-E9_24 [Faustovirus]
MTTYKFMTLDQILKYEPEARRLGVSKVARSPAGFLGAYKRAKGDHKALSDKWLAKRNGFIKRHLAEAKKNHEKLYDPKTKTYSRRGLALTMWAMDPR